MSASQQGAALIVLRSLSARFISTARARDVATFLHALLMRCADDIYAAVRLYLTFCASAVILYDSRDSRFISARERNGALL